MLYVVWKVAVQGKLPYSGNVILPLIIRANAAGICRLIIDYSYVTGYFTLHHSPFYR